jgi:hypothetical protein
MSYPLLKRATVNVSVGVTGTLTLVYSGLNGLSLLGLDLRAGPVKDILAIYPLLAFPAFLLVTISLRWATMALWAFFILQWARCCAISWPVLCLNPLDSFAGKILFAAVLLITLSFILSSLSPTRDKAAVPK